MYVLKDISLMLNIVKHVHQIVYVVRSINVHHVYPVIQCIKIHAYSALRLLEYMVLVQVAAQKQQELKFHVQIA